QRGCPAAPVTCIRPASGSAGPVAGAWPGPDDVVPPASVPLHCPCISGHDDPLAARRPRLAPRAAWFRRGPAFPLHFLVPGGCPRPAAGALLERGAGLGDAPAGRLELG